MQLLPSLLFGISASLDALLVGISYGIRQVHIRLWQNLFISGVSLLGTCLSIGAGHLLLPYLPGFVSRYAGSLVLMLFGLYYIAKWFGTLWQRHGQSAPCADTSLNTASQERKPCFLVPGEVFALSLSLSLNNLSIGLSASLAGLTLLPAAAATLVCSLLLLFLGNRLGRSPLLRLAGCAAEPLSGILLISLGLTQLFLQTPAPF